MEYVDEWSGLSRQNERTLWFQKCHWMDVQLMCLEQSITFGRMARETDYLLAGAMVLPPYVSAHCTANIPADEGSGTSRQQLPEQVVCARGDRGASTTACQSMSNDGRGAMKNASEGARTIVSESQPSQAALATASVTSNAASSKAPSSVGGGSAASSPSAATRGDRAIAPKFRWSADKEGGSGEFSGRQRQLHGGG